MPTDVNLKLNDSVVLDSPNQRSRRFPASLPLPGSPSLMMSEAERRKTYQGWPVNFLPPEVMARAGFFYTKRRDIVRCPFCGIEVSNWEIGDDPWDDHRKWRGTCKFINNEPGHGNIPIGQDMPSSPRPSSPNDSGYDTCGSQEIRGMDQQAGEPGVIPKTKKPSFPDYATLEKRLDSFSLWPVSLKVKPKVLSEAGFYYTGNGDQTICFYCGGGLKDWEDSDDPWTEHAKWFPKCTFILLNKGEQFVHNSGMNSLIHGASENQDLMQSASTAALQQPVSNSEATCSTPANELKGQNSGESDAAMLCKVCYSKGLEVVFLPCGHLMSCIDCSLQLMTCGVCRQPITGVIRTYFP